MLKRNYKVVIVIPAGHFPDIEILLRNLDKHKKYFDECHIWMNCLNNSILPIRELSKKYLFSKCINPQWPEGGIEGIARFLELCTNKHTLYIRLDQDICYIEKNAIKNLVRFKFCHPDHFLTYANCVNNDITSHYYQLKGIVPHNFGGFDRRYGNQARHSADYMLFLHEMFLNDCKNNNLNKYKINNVVWHSSEFGCPVNAVCWFGRDFARFGSKVIGNEEAYLITRNAVNSICGNSIMCHFKYQSQIKHFNKEKWDKSHKLQKEYLNLSKTTKFPLKVL